MIFRQATDDDIPAIIALLKLSLGEEKMPKTEEYWRWKHVYNPFGTSPVLLAAENDTIVGVRAFMRWCWFDGARIIQAVRAVDTATHPSHQGKGIFKKLTLQLLENCSNYGISFVYNTPNKNSYPGYMKMGWQRAGKLPVDIRLINPLRALSGLFLRPGKTQENRDGSVADFLTRPDAASLIQRSQQNANGRYQSFHSINSLRWRYQHVPIVTYHAAGVDKGGELAALCFYRFKMSRFGKELRIADTFAVNSAAQLELKRKIIKLARQNDSAYVATQPNVIKLPGFAVTMAGPMVTVRHLRDEGDFAINDFVGFRNWSPSLGDLELF